MNARRKRLDRLVVRLVSVTFLAGFAAAAAGTALLASSGRANLREDVNAQHEAIAAEVADRVQSRIDAVLSTLKVVATRARVTEVSAAATSDLAAVLRASDRFDELVLLDASGRPVAAAAARFLADAGDYDLDAEVARAAATSDVVRLDADGSVVELAVAVERPPGNVIGALVARAPLEVILHGVLRAPAPGEPTRFLVDRDGAVLVHPDRDRVVGRDRIDLGALGQLPAAGIVEDDERLLRAAASVDSFSGAVVVEQREEVALAPVGSRIRELVTILIAVMGSAVLAISVVGGYLLRPLGPLAASISHLGRGRHGVRVPSSGSGEVATLTEEFNRLADALERREREVAELQRVSLLLHRHAAREDLMREVVAGASAVLDATAAELWELDAEGEVQVATGESALITRPEARELALDAIRTGTPASDDGDTSLGAFPVSAVDGAPGAVVVVERAQRWDERALQLGQALAAVAGVAIENIRRLDLQRELADELQEAADRRRDFLGTVTHEFRTPLTCIEGFSSLLIDHWDAQDDDERRLLVQKIHRHSEELDELVSRLLDFAVTERGMLTANLAPVRLVPLVDDAVAQLAPLLEGRTVRREVEDVTVQADAVLLRRTLTNLLSNAVKYSQQGTPIAIRALGRGDEVRVEVEDQGVGMSAEELARAFTPFWRAGNPSTRGARGAGIGLSLVAEYVETMGGEIDVRSAPGRGSTFAFTLRRAS